MERMSGDSTPDAPTASTTLLPLLGAPVDTDDEASEKAASRCCGGGSCTFG